MPHLMKEVRNTYCNHNFLILFAGTFLLFAKFPKDYPYKPPEMRFVTPV